MTESLLEDNSKIVFEDGQTTIDFVLVYVKDNSNSQSETCAYITQIRKNFIKFLTEKHKIQIKEKIIRTDKMEIGFYLLHLPWHVLIEEAERLRLKVPLKKLKAELNGDTNIADKFSFWRHFHHELPSNDEHNYSEVFKKENSHKFDISKNKQVNFRNSQRQYIMKEILDSIVYREDSSSKLAKFWSRFRSYNRNSNIRLTRLLKEGVLNSAYPLHEGNISHAHFSFKPKKKHEQTFNIDRQLLYDHWASWRCILKFQPINDIEKYFGTKIAFYFAWLGFYTSWLFPMALFGIFFFFFGNLDPSSDEANNFICGDKADTLMMCPLCEECTSWHLSDICMATKLNNMFDNVFTVLFSLLMNFWAIFFLEFWKRSSKHLGHKWGVLDYERDEEKPSPDYCFYATKQRHNPITRQLEPYFPTYISIFRKLFGTLVLMMFICVAVFFHSVVIFMRLSLHHLMFLTEGLRPFASLFSNISSGVLNLFFIVLIDHLYEKVAKKISKWEMFRTETEYEESLILKMFIMLSFNYYSHAFYIAFLKGRIRINFNGASYSETCSHTGCHIEVAFYLFITFAAKQMLKSAYEIAYPRFKRFANIIKSGLPHAINQWENDYQLHQVNDLVDNYLYLVLQFGFVTLFVSVFPLGPLFAFVFNLLAIRINARKLLCESRRMVMVRSNGIGIWFKILATISNFSVLTNALIIAFSSDFIDKLVYFIENKSIDGFTEANLLTSRLDSSNVTCRYFESKYHGDINTDSNHYYKLIFKSDEQFKFKLKTKKNTVSWVQKYIEVSVPDIPRNLDIKIKKERYMIKKNLKLNPTNSKNDVIVDMIQSI